MPKQKTHKGLKKRIKITGTGKVKRPKCGSSHLMSGTPSKQCRQMGKTAIITGKVARNIKTLLNQ